MLGVRLNPSELEREWAGEQADRQVAFVVLEVQFLLAGEQALAGLAEQPIGPAAAQDIEQDLENYFCRLKLFAQGQWSGCLIDPWPEDPFGGVLDLIQPVLKQHLKRMV